MFWTKRDGDKSLFSRYARNHGNANLSRRNPVSCRSKPLARRDAEGGFRQWHITYKCVLAMSVIDLTLSGVEG